MKMRMPTSAHTKWIARLAMKVAVASFALRTCHLDAQGTPVPLSAGTNDAPPQHLRPDWSDNQGQPYDPVQLNSTTIDERIQINRVVSYEVDSTGKLDPNTDFAGVVSKNAKLTVLACVTTDDPKAVGIPVHIQFSKFNDFSLSHTLTCNLVLQRDRVREIGFRKTNFLVPTTQVRFGQANFNPLVFSLTSNSKAESIPPPAPGMNDLQCQMTVDPQYEGRTGHFVIHLFPYLDFDAIAPIIMVHGTAAQADSWLAPREQGEMFDGHPGLVEPFVSPIEGQGLGFFALHGHSVSNPNAPSPPPVPWFFGINLGTIYKSDGVTVDFKKSGNADIATSANQLQTLLRFALDMFGARRCHVIAHSKGGSDARQVFEIKGIDSVFAPAGDIRRDIQKEHYEILSLTTIGTPSRGTPSANLSENVYISASIGVNSGSGDLDAAISADAFTASAMKFMGIGPSGGALRDQMVGSPVLAALNDPSAVAKVLDYTNHHLYSIVGDADLDADQKISFDEGKDFLPLGIPQSSAGELLNYFASSMDSDYQLVGRVGVIEVAKTHDIEWDYISLFPHPYDASQANLVWPNDLVTPLWSGVAPGARVLRLAPDTSGLPFKERSNLPSGYTGLLSGGNHSLLHRGQAAGLIFQQIQADYPIQEPQ